MYIKNFQTCNLKVDIWLAVLGDLLSLISILINFLLQNYN